MSITNELNAQLANAIRILSIDAVEQAQSGHPGMPLGMADIAMVLWHKFMRHNPKNPKWFNRDRFVLSNGHGSMLLYAVLHLTGYNISIDEIKRFRQLHSLTPGHPEYPDTPGVETTTGPLAQGLANAVGMAIAEKILAQQFNRPNHQLIDHFTYVFVGDGCLMEGLSHEVCSLAGTLGLGKLIVFYDDNGISIDGAIHTWFSDDTAARFRAYNWHVIDQVDGHDPDAIAKSIKNAQAHTANPTLIICKTIIGFASPLAGSEKSHGAPLGTTGVNKVREMLNWPHAPFVIPKSIYRHWNQTEKGQQLEDQWLSCCHAYKNEYSVNYNEFLRRINGDLPNEWPTFIHNFITQCISQNKSLATRKSSQICLEQLAPLLPELLGGSADLTSSNNTNWSGTQAITCDNFSGNYLFYGVREFGMAAIMNGLSLHGGFIPYGGTFLVFADYARNAIRLSALMKQRIIYIFTHDSIGLGEDGPTHQPIEHASMLRMTPNMHVWRPADLVETAIAWQEALSHHSGPSCLLLSRQNLPALIKNHTTTPLISKGAYIVFDSSKPLEAIFIATGSEVQLALAAALKLQDMGHHIRVVSMPCCERFLNQGSAYQNEVLPVFIRKRIAIEAAASHYWYRFVGLDGAVIAIDRFGVSAPAHEAYEYLNITTTHIINAFNNL
jgi:transketolase